MIRDWINLAVKRTFYRKFEIKLFTHSGGYFWFSNLLWRLVYILMRCGQQCTLISYCVADMKVKRSLSMPQPVQGATYSPPSQTRPPVGSEVGRRWPSTPALALQVSPSYSQTGTIVIQHRIAIRVYYMERYNYVLVVILFISNLWNYANVHINKTLCQSSYWLL